MVLGNSAVFSGELPNLLVLGAVTLKGATLDQRFEADSAPSIYYYLFGFRTRCNGLALNRL